MGNCACNYALSNSEIYVSQATESHTTLCEPDNNPLCSQKLKNSTTIENTYGSNYKCISSTSSAASSFKKKGPIIVKLQLKRSNKKLL